MQLQRILRAPAHSRYAALSCYSASIPHRSSACGILQRGPYDITHLSRKSFTSSTKLSLEPSIVAKPPSTLSEGERKIFDKLAEQLEPSELEVVDTSGGCGSMYTLKIVSPKFAGLSMIKQHQLVNKTIADEIKEMHGLQMVTRAP